MMFVETVDRRPCTWADLPARWAVAVGPQLALVSRPAALVHDGTLVVIVARDWLDDLTRVRAELLAALPVAVDKVPLRRIQLRAPLGG